MSNEPQPDEESTDQPTSGIELDDPPGRWDNRLALFIATAPVFIILLSLLSVVLSIMLGIVSLDITISGTLPVMEIWNGVVEPLVLVVIIAFAFIWILSVMSWFGADAVFRLGRVIEQMIRDYGGSR